MNRPSHLVQLKDKVRQHLPECDFGVLGHGFQPYMRDYGALVQLAGYGPSAGVHQCLFTHCVVATVETRVQDDVWLRSWQNEFIDYDAWLAAGEPDGFVWGAKWSLAYPGLTFVADSGTAASWSSRLGKPMHELLIETEAFALRLVFHDFQITRLSDEQSPLNAVLIPR